QTQITGTLDIDTPPNQARIELFKARQDPSGYGEGEIFLGFANPDGAGNWSTLVSGLITGDYVTATTTDMNFNTSEFCQNIVVQPGSVEEDTPEKQLSCKLKQNYPNPFATVTTISFILPDAKDIELTIFDLRGCLVKRFSLFSPHSSLTSSVSWDGRNDSGIKVSPGIYFYKLTSKNFTAVKKLTLTK
ncbi:MAG: T9SS type A sorting domain-containing protein, partial [Candidatus Cloacimonadota bacterium]